MAASTFPLIWLLIRRFPARLVMSFLSLPPLKVSVLFCLETVPLSRGTRGSLCCPHLSFLCQSLSLPAAATLVHPDKRLGAVSLLK